VINEESMMAWHSTPGEVQLLDEGILQRNKGGVVGAVTGRASSRCSGRATRW
jgi:hypothetical protein